MAVNPRITTTSDDALAAVNPPAGTVTPPVNAVVLVDGSGNIVKTTDAGGGFSTMDITGGGGGGGGDASAANQVLEIAQLTAINDGTPAALGQATMAASQPVVIASDQSAVPVSGTVAVTGVATAANQATVIASLAAIDAGTPTALGQATMANSAPVAIASDQSSIPVAGNVAAASADSGNPLKIGGKLNTTMPTYTDGQRGDAQIGVRGALKVQVMVADSGNALTQAPDNVDAVVASATANKTVNMSRGTVFNGVSWDRPRVPVIIKTAVATAAGNTVLWTPTGGTMFRVMRAIIMITADSATAGGGVVTIDLQDVDTSVGITASVFVPAAAGTVFGNGFSTGWMDFGHGKLSALANNVLNIDLSAELTSGAVRVIVCGTEE